MVMAQLTRVLFVLIVAVSVGLVIEHVLKPIVPSWLLTCMQVFVGVVIGTALVLIILGMTLTNPTLCSLPLQMPADIEPGTPEAVRMLIQEESLSNVQRADLTETSLAYRAFCANHPAYVGDSDWNASRLSEFLVLKYGVPVVPWGDARVPLETSVDQWESAYDWAAAQGHISHS
jgi:hypothetical protein